MSLDDNTLPPGSAYLLAEDESTGIHTQRLPVPSSDPNDPLNWPQYRKLVNFTFTMAATAVIFTLLSIQNVFWQLMIVDLRITYGQLINANAVGLTGCACGCLLFIPLAIKFGRRPVYIVSIFVMLIMSIVTALAPNITTIYIANLIQGLAGSTNETIVQMTIADLFFVHERARANALYMVMVMIGSFLAPVISGYMSEAKGWRFCYWILTAFFAALWIAFAFFFEETKYNVVRLNGLVLTNSSEERLPGSRDDKHTKEIDLGGRQSMNSTHNQTETPPTSQEPQIDSTIPMDPWKKRLRLWTPSQEPLAPLYYRPLRILITFPAVTYTALQYAFCLCWISVLGTTISSIMPYPPYRFGPAAIGLMNLACFVGCILGSIYAGLLGDWIVLLLAKRNKGLYEPEMRLHMIHLPAILMPAGLLMFGLTIARSMHWIYLAIGAAIFGFGLGGISDASLTYTLDCYREIAGEAFTGIAFLRNVFSIAVVFALNPWIKAQGVQNMYIVDTVWSLVIALLYIPFLIYGKKLRMKLVQRYQEFAAQKGDLRM